MNTVQLQVKSVYGNKLIYPVNESAKTLARLTGTKTFTKVHIKDMEVLGFKIEYIAEQP